MVPPGRALRWATAATRGHVPPDHAWPAVLDIANRGWLGPAVFLAFDRTGQLGAIPSPLRDYLSFLHQQNLARNRRLRAQLEEAIFALNGAGIEPVLLKGAIHLATASDERLGERLTSDLDIHVRTGQVTRATTALNAIGYELCGSNRELGRREDAGVIELHDRPNARSAPYLTGDLYRSSPRTVRDGICFNLPSPTSRALHLIVHDMIKEGDYWSFRIDLRHLHDLSRLAESLDWHELGAALCDGLARRALALQALALDDLFDVEVPAALLDFRGQHWRHLARVTCTERGLFQSCLRTCGALSRGRHQLGRDYAWRGIGPFSKRVQERLLSRNAGSRL